MMCDGKQQRVICHSGVVCNGEGTTGGPGGAQGKARGGQGVQEGYRRRGESHVGVAQSGGADTPKVLSGRVPLLYDMANSTETLPPACLPFLCSFIIISHISYSNLSLGFAWILLISQTIFSISSMLFICILVCLIF
eukprot:TRINITY_DN3418_c0_g1_i1.p1 TRINITY_DN3418_c0_g1~~TRINITY_DN3418_c0_g1_i1.p1  ORF type:complete len:137 (-),score=11.87 TRINITY_DN3418_c0_g1_i1:117-527(-)